VSEGAKKLISFIQEWTMDQNEMWEYRDWQICYIEISLNSKRPVNSKKSHLWTSNCCSVVLWFFSKETLQSKCCTL
jgi:hypothetical protein